MDFVRTTFHEFLSRTPLSHREDELFVVFDNTLDVLNTYMGAREDFEELILYMQTHFKDFTYSLMSLQRNGFPLTTFCSSMIMTPGFVCNSLKMGLGMWTQMSL